MIKLPKLKTCLLLLLAVAFVSCKSSKKESSTTQAEKSGEYLVFLDKSRAESQIVKDATDGFFESISIADMSIQLKKTEMPEGREVALEMYKDFLKTEMQDFTKEEEQFMHAVFDSAKDALDKINPKLLPSTIELIKTKTNHYGPNVYYTRERAIILPDNIFESPSVDVQMPVMLHEIFHILSRYNKDFREEMYALIGFEHYEEDLVVPKEISDRLLTNPDGVRRDYAITLEDEAGKTQKAIPLIMSTKERYQENVPTFFGYLFFDLFPLVSVTDNTATLGLSPKGESVLSSGHNANFFRQIKDNTQYIIHPDEIMADNFMMAVIANKNESYENFSEEGRALLEKVMTVLKNFDPESKIAQ